MVAVARTFTVPQPVEEVVGYLKDFSHTEQWDPGTVSCTRSDGAADVRVGSRWTNTSTFLGRTAVLDYRLERLEPRHLVFRGSNASATSCDDLTFAETPEGTRITYRAEIRFLHTLPRLLGPLLRRPFNRLADDVVTQMTEVFEGL